MQLQQGAGVLTASGDKLGVLDRVVVDPRDHTVTHLVVQKGLLLKTDKVVPIELVAITDEDEIRLREAVTDLDNLPEYEETHYVVADERELLRRPGGSPAREAAHLPVAPVPAPGMYWYPPATADYPAYSPTLRAPTEPGGPAYRHETRRNIPEHTVAVKEGAQAIAADGEHVGNVERLFTDAKTNQVTHLLLSKGLVLKQRKVVPMDWVLDVAEDQVRLAVGSELLQGLRDYEA